MWMVFSRFGVLSSIAQMKCSVPLTFIKTLFENVAEYTSTQKRGTFAWIYHGTSEGGKRTTVRRFMLLSQKQSLTRPIRTVSLKRPRLRLLYILRKLLSRRKILLRGMLMIQKWLRPRCHLYLSFRMMRSEKWPRAERE